MNRRAFFFGLAAIAAGATLDPERLLWRPGAKLISIPKPMAPSDDFDLAIVYFQSREAALCYQAIIETLALVVQKRVLATPLPDGLHFHTEGV